MKLYMSWTVPLSTIRSFNRTNSSGVCHTGLLTTLEQDQDRIGLFLLLVEQ